MISLKTVSSRLFLIPIALCCFFLIGCGGLLDRSVKPSDPGNYAAQEQEILVNLHCPQKDRENYDLWLSHFSAIDIDPGTGDTISLEFQNLDPISFDLWIDSDGSVSNQGLFQTHAISYHGTAHHPNSDDCPVQTFNGSWKIKVSISGTCKNDLVQVHIVEEWIDPVLESDCVGPISPGPGLYSAPELDLTFNLADEIPSDSVVIEGSGTFQAEYTYYLWPAESSLPLVPLVPER
jgi:hypothetical protein